MTRPAFGRRLLPLLLAVCLVPAVPARLSAQGERGPTLSRLDRLERWVQAVERHQPGEQDAALRSLDSWTANDLAEVKITFSAVLQLVRDPTVRIFYRPVARGSRPAQVLYSLQELRRLIAIAERLAPLGDNHVLKRAAMMHTDAALDRRSDASGERRRTEFFVLRFNDGQEVNREDSIGHWDMARFLLDLVQPDKRAIRPEPGRDGWVRRWYGMAIAYMLERMEYAVGTANRGLELFRDDHEMLFLAGVMHETLASPAVQEAFREADHYLRTALSLSSRRGELNTAEELLRRSLTLNPGFAEARLHLGHVLAEQGEHTKALAELAQALASVERTDLVYYGHVFSGRSAAALGQAAAAREAYQRAARLKPTAQSPLLALSQLAYSRGDVGEAAALLARVGDLASEERDEPWWTYNVSVGRLYFEPLRREIVGTLRAEMRK